MSKLLDQFNREYEFLYDHGTDNVIGYGEALDWFDKNQTNPEVSAQLTKLVKERQDFVASDREAAAFAFACEILQIG